MAQIKTDAHPILPHENQSGNEQQQDAGSSASSSSSDEAVDSPGEIVSCQPTPPASVIKKEFNISHSNNVHIGNNYTIQKYKVNKYANKENSKLKLKKDNASQKKYNKVPASFMESTTDVTTDHFFVVKRNAGVVKYKDIGRCLGLEDPQIDSIELKHHLEGSEEICFQMLRCWYESVAEKRTVGELAVGLKKAQRFDIIYELYVESNATST